MGTASIRQKLYEYISVAEDKKVKAMYTMFEGDIDAEFDFWADDEVVATLKKRSEEMASGKVKGIGWDEARQMITGKKSPKNGR